MILLSMEYEYKDINKKIVEKNKPNFLFDGSLVSDDFILLYIFKKFKLCIVYY